MYLLLMGVFRLKEYNNNIMIIKLMGKDFEVKNV